MENNEFLLELYDGAQQCNPAEFTDHALDQLKRLIYFDSAGVATFARAPDQKISIQSLHLKSVDMERFHDRTRTVGVEKMGRNGALASRDAVAAHSFAQPGRSVIVDIEKTFSSRDILKYCRKYETAHSLAFIAKPGVDGTISGIALWRAARKNPYEDGHGKLATLVLPHLFQALAINRRIVTAAATGQAIALSNLKGYLYFIEPETIRLLQTEWSEWCPPRLPRALIESLERNGSHIFVGAAIEIRATVRDKLIHFQISQRQGSTMGLTIAEHRVATLAASGMPYKQIAKQLEVSPATVRNQLHAAYRKIGVANKTELAAALR